MAVNDVTIEEALTWLRTPSYERLRAEHMGWRFSEPHITQHPIAGYEMRVKFTCVCGRREEFMQVVPRLYLLKGMDPVAWLERNGSFSRPHLEQDGYTEQQIAEIERRAEEFDRIVAKRYERDLMRHHPEAFYALQKGEAFRAR